MLEEYLNLAFSWFRSQGINEAQIIYSDDQVKFEDQMVSFVGNNFKIMANLQKIIVIGKIDPYFASKVLSPFYPINDDLPISLMKIQNKKHVIFQQTYNRLVQKLLIPVIVDVHEIKIIIDDYFRMNDSIVGGLESIEQECIKQTKLINALVANSLIEAMSLFQKYLKLRPKLEEKEIIEIVLNLTFSQFDATHFYGCQLPELLVTSGKFIQELLIIIKNLLIQLFQSNRSIIKILIDNQFAREDLIHVLTTCIENELGIITIQMNQFALVQQADFLILYDKIKEVIFDLAFEIETYIVLQSKFISDQMKILNSIFETYPALANIRSYQMIQTDTSAKIIQDLDQIFLEERDFWRPEMKNSIKFIKNLVICYAEYDENNLLMPTKTTDFYSSLIRAGIEPQQLFLTYQLSFNEQIDYIDKKDEIMVLSVEEIVMNDNKVYKLELDGQEPLFIWKHKRALIMARQAFINPYIKPQNHIIVNKTLNDTIQQLVQQHYQAKQLNLLENQDNLIQTDKSNQLVIHFSLDLENQLSNIKEKFLNKIYDAQRVGGPNSIDPTVLAAGAVGSGLGILIVDCLDENITWQQKLQRAGFGTAETTAFAALSVQLPFIGFLIGQTFLFYSLHKLFSNKVVSTKNKLKTMGHMGVKTSMGIGSAVAGQILIPIPVLGALLGSVVGGVGVGLYQKFVVPSTKSSLMKMIFRMADYIQKDGSLIYDKMQINILRIQPQHFFENQPDQLNNNQWITLSVIHLVNEVEYLYKLQCEQQRKKLLKEMEKKMEIIQDLSLLENEQEEIEAQLLIWDVVRLYVGQNLNSFRYSTNIGKFVSGLIMNYKL
ncbi:hypothetical protein pb186bvf_005868 [Paramecium bursaria]